MRARLPKQNYPDYVQSDDLPMACIRPPGVRMGTEGKDSQLPPGFRLRSKCCVAVREKGQISYARRPRRDLWTPAALGLCAGSNPQQARIKTQSPARRFLSGLWAFSPPTDPLRRTGSPSEQRKEVRGGLPPPSRADRALLGTNVTGTAFSSTYRFLFLITSNSCTMPS